ncbi:DUF1080 domain-containing protein [Mariniphaga sediminis]|uniref:DUF1080 domain-containing protein n=1 Tax=Mariniphaga sediminis TaxID=1628158 RepID=A0A399CV79_9BACT|nr:DUF1080 domain-containing protein [Mariniphaga sediminis]RIH63519.1 DUF1080 domain-containing protein [Mariniphaga sediminis]
MKKIIPIALLAAFILFLNPLSGMGASGEKATDLQKEELNKLTKEEKKEGWKLLFNGVSLKGWKTFNGGKVDGWKVIDGVLNNSGKGSDHGGDIITKKKYDNFELYLEWNISPLSNSGIFIRVQEDIVNTIYKTAPEYQLSDDIGITRKREKYQFTAACYAMYETTGAEINPPGDWNSSQIVVNGPHVEHWLNGEKVVEYELWSRDWKERKAKSKWKDEPHYGMAEKGHVGLQDHGGLTRFRNIKIREL